MKFFMIFGLFLMLSIWAGCSGHYQNLNQAEGLAEDTGTFREGPDGAPVPVGIKIAGSPFQSPAMSPLVAETIQSLVAGLFGESE